MVSTAQLAWVPIQRHAIIVAVQVAWAGWFASVVNFLLGLSSRIQGLLLCRAEM